MGQAIKLSLPLHGTPGKDFFIDYMPDCDPTPGISDARCGTKTYNEHTGTDFIIRSFKTMDSGVTVYAAADGEVMTAYDLYYDRNKNWEASGLANRISILHADGMLARYGHLMKHSILVAPGQKVVKGQAIAKVGSSGASYFPHLHFELVRNDTIFDPFGGTCGQENEMWEVPPPYDTALYLIDAGFVPYVPRQDALQERELLRDSFSMATDTVVCLWVQVHGLRTGDKIKVKWLDPQHGLCYKYTGVWQKNWWYAYGWAYIPVPRKKGSWRAQYYVNRKLLADKQFFVQE